MSREFMKLLSPLSRRLRLMASRAVLSLIADAPGIQLVQVKLLDGEVRNGIERFQQYGCTSVPHPGAEGICLSLGADRDHGVVIVMDDRRYRLKGLENGEVALYDDLGQKVHLTRNGIVIDGAGLPITITDTPKVRMETPLLEVTGDIHDRCDTIGRTMQGMRDIYNIHVHPENDGGGPTDDPNEQM